MDLRQLRYFLRIVEAGSFSKAADLLHVAQPSLSQHVRALEEELGVELLHRHARGVSPTDLGFILCDRARLILREVDAAKESIRESAESVSGEVVVGLSTATCRGLAVPLIKAVSAAYPLISLHIVEAMSGSLNEWVQSGRLDLALSYDDKSNVGLPAIEVVREELRLILPVAHRLAACRAVPLAAVADLPLALPSRPHAIRRVIEQCFAVAGLELSVAVNCDSTPTIIELVRHGYTTLLPSFAILQEIERHELVAVPIVDPTPSWQLSIFLSHKSTNSRGAEIVAGLLNQVAHDLVQQGTWPAQLKQIGAVGRRLMS